MEHQKEEKSSQWLSVPQFGDWDQKGAFPDYSMDFSKIRESRKQNKRDLSRASLGNEEEFVSSAQPKTVGADHHRHNQYHQRHHSPIVFIDEWDTCGGLMWPSIWSPLDT